MKSYLAGGMTLVLVALATNPARAQEPGPRNAVTTNPVFVAAGFYTVEYERVLSDHFSLAVDPGIVRVRLSFQDEQARSDGWAVGMSGRWYPTGTAPHGWFVSPLVQLAQLETTVVSGEDTVSASGTMLGVGGVAGYSFLLWDRALISAGAGGHLLVGPVSAVDVLDDGYTVAFLARLNLGFVF